MDEVLINEIGFESEEEIKEIEAVEEVCELEEAVVEATTILGVVSNCKKLNIRSAPSKSSAILAVVPVDTEVTIVESNLLEDAGEWCRVYTASGVSGFCMRDFITLR